MATLPFYAANFAWNFALGMTYMLVPLHALSQGLSGVAIGSLLGIPILVQVWLNLVGGAYTDRMGGYRMALLSCFATGGGGVIYLFASTFEAMLVAQLVLAVGRSMFWPASWAIGSQLPGGDIGRRMGRLNSTGAAGQIAGTGAAGIVIGAFGFGAGFGLYIAAAVVAFLLLLGFKSAPRTRAPGAPIIGTYLALLRKRPMYFGMMCAYLSAIPFSLSQSFFPILLVDRGYASDATGWVVALRALGSIAAGLVIARYVRHVTRYGVPLASGFAVAACLAVLPLFVNPALVGLVMLGIGLGSGVMTVYFQLLVSELSTPTQRGSALAIGAFGYSLSHLSTPLLMGAMKDAIGIVNAFYVMGLIAVAWTLALVPAHRWAFAGHAPRPA